MSISVKLNEAIKNWLNSENIDCVEVIKFDESYSSSSCGYDTCVYDEWEVEIWFKDSNGKIKIHSYDGNFSRLINILDKFS
jgi:hypothetical protein